MLLDLNRYVWTLSRGIPNGVTSEVRSSKGVSFLYNDTVRSEQGSNLSTVGMGNGPYENGVQIPG